MSGEVPQDEIEHDEKMSPIDSSDDAENRKPSVDTSIESIAAGSLAVVSRVSNCHQKQQDAYVKKGTRVALLLKTALRAMAEGLAVSNEPAQNNSGEKRPLEEGADHKRRRKDSAHAEQIALEKAEECNDLRRVRFNVLVVTTEPNPLTRID